MAILAIEHAEMLGADPQAITEAKDALDQSRTDRLFGELVDAIGHFRTAWQIAQEAAIP